MDKKDTKKAARKYFEEPKCSTHKDCFANRNGKCICLSDNDFGRRDCVFYKAGSEVRNG